MRWLNRVKAMFRPSNASNSVEMVDGIWLAKSGASPARGSDELAAVFNSHPWFRAVVGKVATGVADVSWRAYARTGKGGKAVKDAKLSGAPREVRSAHRRALARGKALREVEDHPILAVLDRPNPHMTGFDLIRLYQIWMEVHGECFWVLQKNAEGMPEQIWPFPPHWVKSTPTENDPVFRLNIAGSQAVIKPENMLWLRDINPANPYGRGSGVALALGDELEASEYLSKHLKNWFFNSAVPGFIVSFEGANPAEVKAAGERWEAKYRGPGTTNRVHFAAGKMNLQRVDTSFRDMQVHELSKGMRDFIRTTIGAPPEIFGIVENSNRATAQAAGYLYAFYCILPRTEALRRQLQAKLCPLYDDRLVLDYDSPLPEDREATISQQKNHPYAFDLNEIRAVSGHEPRPELEGVYPPLAMPGQSPAGGGDAPEEPTSKPPKPKADPPWVRSGGFILRAGAESESVE